MENIAPDPDNFFDPLNFTPAPTVRARHDGWTPERQRRFIAALAAMGSVGPALRAVGMGRVAAYALRKRKGAESFAAAWDTALFQGRMDQYSYAMNRAVNGVTIIRVRKGGTIEVQGMPDVALMRSALREEPHG